MSYRIIASHETGEYIAQCYKLVGHSWGIDDQETWDMLINVAMDTADRLNDLENRYE